jgi:hypothetical protein
MLRGGLRNEEVNALARGLRTKLSEGMGPEEAWAETVVLVPGVDPGVFVGWKDEIFKLAETAAPAPMSQTNIFQRTVELTDKLEKAERKLAEMGNTLEKSQDPELPQKFVNIQAENAELRAQVLKLQTDLDAAEELLKDKKPKK